MSKRYTDEQLENMIGDVFTVIRIKEGFSSVGKKHRAEIESHNRVRVYGSLYTLNDDSNGQSLFTYYKIPIAPDDEENEKFRLLLVGGDNSDPFADLPF